MNIRQKATLFSMKLLERLIHTAAGELLCEATVTVDGRGGHDRNVSPDSLTLKQIIARTHCQGKDVLTSYRQAAVPARLPTVCALVQHTRSPDGCASGSAVPVCTGVPGLTVAGGRTKKRQRLRLLFSPAPTAFTA